MEYTCELLPVPAYMIRDVSSHQMIRDPQNRRCFQQQTRQNASFVIFWLVHSHYLRCFVSVLHIVYWGLISRLNSHHVEMGNSITVTKHYLVGVQISKRFQCTFWNRIVLLNMHMHTHTHIHVCAHVYTCRHASEGVLDPHPFFWQRVGSLFFCSKVLFLALPVGIIGNEFTSCWQQRTRVPCWELLVQGRITRTNVPYSKDPVLSIPWDSWGALGFDVVM